MKKKVLIILLISLFYNTNLTAQKKEIQKEIDSITSLIKNCNRCYYEYFERAKLYIENKRKVEGMKDLNQVIRKEKEFYNNRIKDSRLTTYYNERGKLKLDLKDYRGGILDFDKAVDVANSISSVWVEVFFNRAFCKSKIGKYNEAIEDYEKVFKHSYNDDYTNRMTHYNIGLLKIKVLRIEEGCLNLSKAGELGMTDAYKVISKHCNK
ncbi:tetratricopeptide repeat protein [Polaribacter butkevichii]|uniref:Uncharacterized protein n=1 Tax=Polaribacter butkevichii TaxID=218490 RepID=A0A2P6C9V1_9FLAO|nr:hypothetical protein [Polaribacter butkevichii]PQJ69659.1 hypothetical protein BTO14_16845 [Polaribacter butkevichii]